MADNPFAICRRIALERAAQRFADENPGLRAYRVAGEGEISPAEIKLHRRRNATIKILDSDRGTMASRTSAPGSRGKCRYYQGPV